MRFYEIVLYLFVFNLVIGTMASAGIYPEFTVQQNTEWVAQINNTIETINATTTGVQPDDPLGAIWTQANLLMQSIWFITTTFVYATVAVPWMFVAMGMPAYFALTLSAGLYIIYIIGLFQIYSGRSTRQME